MTPVDIQRRRRRARRARRVDNDLHRCPKWEGIHVTSNARSSRRHKVARRIGCGAIVLGVVALVALAVPALLWFQQVMQMPQADGDLLVAATDGDVDGVIRSLNAGADINARIPASGSAPLHLAARFGRLDVVRVLVDRGADLSAATSMTGKAPIHFAAESGHLDVIEFLLDAGVDVNSPNKRGRTPLYYAMKDNHREVAELLRSRGAHQ